MTNTTCPKCGKPSDPKSTRKGYCTEDMLAARAAFKEMIANKPTKADREAAHEALYLRALEAANEAASKVTPVPMYVQNNSTGQTWKVDGGVCGFAWVNITPGNSSFARWMKDKGYARRDSYEGGVTVWSGNVGGQSLAIKEAWASAFAGVLTDAGITAHSRSRLD